MHTVLLHKHVDDNCQVLSMRIKKDIQLTVIYISDSSRIGDVKSILEPMLNMDLFQIVTGDFNYDKDEENKLTKFFQSMGMVQLITQPTHNHGRTLDHCYVSQGHLQLDVKVVSPYYSDHSGFCLKLVEPMEV